MISKCWNVVREGAIKIYEYYDVASTLKGFIVIIFLLIIAIAWLLGIDKRIMNKRSRKQIDKLINNKKYIRGLFVELNECKEYLRYFANRDKWKKRLIKDYNMLFADYNGHLLKEAFTTEQINLNLHTRATIETVIDTIEQTKIFLSKLHEGKVDVPERYADSIIRFEIYSNSYDEQLFEMLTKAQLIKKNYCVLIGSAGNGKTNMLCSFSELLMAMKRRCIYIDGRDIKENVESYVWDRIGIPKSLNHLWFKKIYYYVSQIRNKEVFIIIDAINENDNDIGDELVAFINNVQKLKNVRLLISCRSEYFEARYKKILVDSINEEPVCIDLLNSKYGIDAMHRMFNIYSKAFVYSGNISDFVKEKLCKQLLAMRIFFEVNEKGNKDYLDLNTYSLIQEYIEKIGRIKEVQVESLLFEIADSMIEQNSFNEVKISLLSVDGQRIQKTIEDTMLTSKTIVIHEGRLHQDKELAVQFVYDEVRDYCLARRFLVQTLKDTGSIDIEKLKTIFDKLTNEKAVCTEGVIKYIYRDSHRGMDNSICNLIISEYADAIDDSNSRRNMVLDWTMQLILDTTDELLPCENAYIKNVIHDHKRNQMSRLFSFLVNQEKINGKHTLNIILSNIKEISKMEDVREIVSSCTSGWGDEVVSHNDFISIDKELEKVNIDSLNRFREFILLYFEFFDWEGKRELKEYLADKNLQAIVETISREYNFIREMRS